MQDEEQLIAESVVNAGIANRGEDRSNAEVASIVVKKTDRTLGRISELVERAEDARTALAILCDYWRKDWIDFIDQSGERLKEIRMFRMAFDTETKLVMAALKDVRQFFLNENHETEVARLKEFVELCERLQKLKASGFLDTVADTMLKLM